MSDTVGVMFDSAQFSYQNQIWFAGDCTPQLNLFESDDTPTQGSDPRQFFPLQNVGYAPLDLPPSSLHQVPQSDPDHTELQSVSFGLAGPSPGDDTIFGWWIGALFDGSTVGPLWGGRFDPPIVIPPAGLDLTFDRLAFFLHDCNAPPPPPPAGIDVLAIYFPNTGISLNASAPQIGADWSVVSGAWNGQAFIEALSDSGSSSINLAVIDTGAGDGVLDTFIQVPFSGGVGFVARLSDASNYWRCYADRTTGKIYLDKIVAGVSTTVNSAAASVGGGSLHKIDLVMAGNVLTMTWDNTVSINSGGDSFNQTATKHGLYAGLGAAAAVFYYTAQP